MGEWRNGSRARFRIWCRKTQGFKSPFSHGSFTIHHEVKMLNTAEAKKIIKESGKRSGADFIEALDAHIRKVLAEAVKIDLGKRKTLAAEDVATAIANLK